MLCTPEELPFVLLKFTYLIESGYSLVPSVNSDLTLMAKCCCLSLVMRLALESIEGGILKEPFYCGSKG